MLVLIGGNIYSQNSICYQQQGGLQRNPSVLINQSRLRSIQNTETSEGFQIPNIDSPRKYTTSGINITLHEPDYQDLVNKAWALMLASGSIHYMNVATFPFALGIKNIVLCSARKHRNSYSSGFITLMMNTAIQEPRRSPHLKERIRSEVTNEDGERATAHLDAVSQITVKFSLPANIGTFELPKINISVQPSLPSSFLWKKSKSTTGDIISLTKEHNEVLESTKDERNTLGDTLLSTITEGESFLASVKTKAIAHQHSTAELRAKLRVAETELKESAAAFDEEIPYFKEDVTARDNEIGRLRGEFDRLSRQKDKNAKLVQRNLELESMMEMQSSKLKELEDWRMQMRRMLSGDNAEP
ncbi:hypothetical protein BCON_0031g00150 [Botryotinia convoluta]|uniref:Uncharacterized protein n=1 Tax=Botryotinia convoluta TaxID=54673 RepID=A0A4Z1IHJ9_9HELO|nr:hypothetical protein BCON_0031g00150 [Botryotinia convoluta]